MESSGNQAQITAFPVNVRAQIEVNFRHRRVNNKAYRGHHGADCVPLRAETEAHGPQFEVASIKPSPIPPTNLTYLMR